MVITKYTVRGNSPSKLLKYPLHSTMFICRGKKFEEYCEKLDVDMDDVLPGVIIDGVLGIDLNVTDEFKSQLDFTFGGNSEEVKEQAQVGCICMHGSHCTVINIPLRTV